jgi:adenylyltransferase/sulfurtransferase
MKKLNNEDYARFTRHFSLAEIGETGQQKLKNAKVLVVGAGGLGSPLLLYLAAAGVGTIGIADDDVVDTSNLQRQVLYGTSAVGEKKVKQAAIRLEELYPAIEIHAYDSRLTKENCNDLISAYDIIADCSDNYSTRQLIGISTALVEKPLVFASVLNFEGQVTVFNYQGGPTFSKLFPTLPADGIYKEPDIGLLGVLPGIAGTIQANEIIKIITGYGETLSGKLLVFSIDKYRFNLFEI